MKKTFTLIIVQFAVSFCYAQTYYEQALEAYNADNYDKALELFDQDLKNDPADAYAYYYKASIYNEQNENTLAFTNVNLALKYFKTKDKKSMSAAYTLRASIFEKIEDYDEALKDYISAIKLTPKDTDLYNSIGDIHTTREKYDLANLEYNKVLAMDAANTYAMASLGRNYTTEKKYDLAEKIFNKLVLLDSKYSAGYYYRAVLYSRIGKENLAINDMFNSFLLDDTDQNTEDLFIEYARKNYDLAIAKVSSQINKQPEDYKWYQLRGNLYNDQENYKNAIEDYNKAIEKADEDNKVYLFYKRGLSYYYAGIHNLAINDLTLAISKDSSENLSYYYRSRADAKSLNGDYNGSLEDYNKAIALMPENAGNYSDRAWIKSKALKDFNGALEDYKKAIALDDSNVGYYLNIANLYKFKFQNLNLANENYAKVITMDSILTDGHYYKQSALFQLGKEKEATDWSEEMAKKYPNDGNFYNLACLYSLMNKPNESIKKLKIAFEKGFHDFIHMEIDDELDNIRNLPEYKSLVIEWKKKFEESLKSYPKITSIEESIKSETITIPMRPEGGGVFEITCKINDLPLKFIFDTGASDISISNTEAKFMIKNGYLKSEDIIGKRWYSDANGDIEEGTKILLRKVDFGGLILKNITASIVNNSKAPLLFGQSALSKYGKVLIDNKKNTLTIITN